MKQRLLLSVLLVLFVGIKAQAYEWTDENGVTWTFSQRTYTINGESQKLWSIDGASGYGEEVTIPSIVYNGTTPCTVEAIYKLFSQKERTATSVTVPSTIKHIHYNSSSGIYNPFRFYAGIVTMMGATPPTLSDIASFGAGVTVMVPNSSLNAYRTADVWKDMDMHIISQSVETTYNITSTAQASASGIHQVIGEENLGNVMSLTVSGSINSYDIMIIRNKMLNLHYLDLTNANIVANSYCYYQSYSTTDNVLGDNAFFSMTRLISVKLPKSCTEVNSKAFAGCAGLSSVSLPACQTVGSYAFQNCYSLTNVSLPVCQTIGSYAFWGCGSLPSIFLPVCQKISSGAFKSCDSLAGLSLPACQTIGYEAFISCTALANVSMPVCQTIVEYAFSGCESLTSVSMPVCQTIGKRAFQNCESLTSVSMPVCQIIDEEAFVNCTSLAELHIPSSITSIGNKAFFGCTALKDYYAYTIEPTSITESTFSNWTSATLHIPTHAYDKYYYDTQWSKFAKLVQDVDYQYQYFYLTQDYTFNDAVGAMNSTPDVNMNAGSGLIVETTNETVTLGDVHLMDNGTTSGSIVANNNLTVENLFFDMTVAANKWYFLSLPFRVKAENVTAPGPYVFRYYDGATRAANGSGGWKNHTGEYLEAHTGYIFQTNTAGTLTFQMEPADVSFSGDTRQNAMATHVATNAKNASWNFMGNPFPSYYDIDDTGYDAPITVWNGSSYIAVRPGDDLYQIGPFQAFFVQKPEAVTNMEFPFAGCHTYNQWAEIVAGKNMAPRRARQKNRQLVNLTIGMDETVDDRTRVVFNEQKTTTYELDCDAAKFLSSEPVAQLYSLDDEQSQYAINERPKGDVPLGYVAAENGMLTITAERMDQPVLLYDKVMNIQHDLSTGGYTFSTEAGTFNDRFVMTINGNATAITQQPSPDTQQPTDVFSLGGSHVSSKGTDGLSSGTYVVKQGGVSTKVIVK